MAEIILDKCITTNGHDKTGTPNTTQIVYNYEFIDDFDKPVLSHLEDFLLRKILRYKYQSQERDIPLMIINPLAKTHEPSLVPANLLPSPSLEQHSGQCNTISLLGNWGPKVYDKDNHTFSLMVIAIVSF